MLFKKAERKKAFLKIAITGVSGSGKTYSALQLAKGLGGKIAMIDTENGSGELYSNLCDYDVAPMEAPFTPEKYVQYIHEAENAGYNVLIIDSLSHAWAGEGGVLDYVDKKTSSSSSRNSFTAWKEATPKQNKMVDAILQSKMDIIVCMRSKQAYEIVENDKGKKTPMKMGLAPIQRDGLEYEFTIMFDISLDRHMATATKDRTGLFVDWCDVITPKTGKQIRKWSDSGAEITENKFVRLEHGKAYVLTSSGMTDIFTLSYDQLEQLLKLPKYSLAHNAIRERLDLMDATQEAIPETKEAELGNDVDFSAEEIEAAAQVSQAVLDFVDGSDVFKQPEVKE